MREKIPVHVERKDRQFWNGRILQKRDDDVWLFDENKFGLMYLFLSDVWEIEEFLEARE